MLVFRHVREQTGLSPLTIRWLCHERLKFSGVPDDTDRIQAEAALLFFLADKLRILGFDIERSQLILTTVWPLLEGMRQVLEDYVAGAPIELHQIAFVDGTFFTYTGATEWTDVRDGSRHLALPQHGLEVASYVLPELFRRYSTQGCADAESVAAGSPGPRLG
jgi:hypothetical protein